MVDVFFNTLGFTILSFTISTRGLPEIEPNTPTNSPDTLKTPSEENYPAVSLREAVFRQGMQVPNLKAIRQYTTSTTPILIPIFLLRWTDRRGYQSLFTYVVTLWQIILD